MDNKLSERDPSIQELTIRVAHAFRDGRSRTNDQRTRGPSALPTASWIGSTMTALGPRSMTDLRQHKPVLPSDSRRSGRDRTRFHPGARSDTPRTRRTRRAVVTARTWKRYILPGRSDGCPACTCTVDPLGPSDDRGIGSGLALRVPARVRSTRPGHRRHPRRRADRRRTRDGGRRPTPVRSSPRF